MIRLLQRNELDIAKWNACIAASPSELVYPYSWYLDAAVYNWEALVENDYEAVMPLPYTYKAGIKYLALPRFCQQLGLFSGKQISSETLKEFLFFLLAKRKDYSRVSEKTSVSIREYWKHRYVIGDYALNEGNTACLNQEEMLEQGKGHRQGERADLQSGYTTSRTFNYQHLSDEQTVQSAKFEAERHAFRIKKSINYTLSLNASLEDLRKAYSQNCKRNLKKTKAMDSLFHEDIAIANMVAAKRKYDVRDFGNAHYDHLTSMFSSLREQERVKAMGVVAGDEILAAAIFAFSEKRIHYLLSFSSEEGKKMAAMFYVLDKVVEKYAGNDLLLDFEGSNNASIARFFAGFGAVPHEYLRVSFERSFGKVFRFVKNVRHH